MDHATMQARTFHASVADYRRRGAFDGGSAGSGCAICGATQAAIRAAVKAPRQLKPRGLTSPVQAAPAE